MMRPQIGLPLPMPRGGHMDGPYRFPPQGPVMLPGGPPGMGRPQMQIALGPRGPMHGGPLVLSRMPGPPPPGVHPQQPVLVMQRPGVQPGMNGPPHVRQQMAPGPPGICQKNFAFQIIHCFNLRCASLFQFNDSYVWSTSTWLLSRSARARGRFYILFETFY
jgi:hypothetical protein